MRLFWMEVPAGLEEAASACRNHFRLAAGFSALINILYLAPTIYMMQIYDRVVPTSGVFTLFWLTVVIALAIGTLTSLDAIRSRVMMQSSLRLNRLLSGRILDRLLARQAVNSGAAASQALREFDTLRQSLAGPAGTVVFDVPWTPIFLLVAFMIHPALGFLILGAGTVLILLAITNGRRNREALEATRRSEAKAYMAQEETLRNVELVRALGMRRALVTRHIAERRAGLGKALQLQISGGRYNGVIKFIRMFMQSFALGMGAWLAIEGQISIGSIIAASVLLSRALQPIEQLVGVWPQLNQARQALHSLGEILAKPADGRPDRTMLPEPEGRLELAGVVVRADDDQTLLLKRISLKLVPGEVLGIIGPSGAGKTTLARVAAGALAPDLGELRIDDASADDWDPERLSQHIGYLPQDCALLAGTISENISRFAAYRGVPQPIIDLEVVKAAKLAGVHEMILRLPNGYDTMLEGSGKRLSAGQAQRVALARALYGGPRVLILDEPNSALDGDGEAALTRAVAAARANGAAVMIVAHRPAILGSAARLALLNDGEIARIGPREEVLAAITTAMKARAAKAPQTVGAKR
ncbi:type I secretion system permease/ATPase [Stakelama marina]|uniref:Type I secretion system permease/ATPase n=1 Tax=Stakelama marina TaxID=2826939 RepID=A0A8T4IDE2_9SPHN|nr:type I secretion system permease/ATPase [Stakelama marina]MBR0551005.1 type I secretion system permease/ATPase [Stakelama marina]